LKWAATVVCMTLLVSTGCATKKKIASLRQLESLVEAQDSAEIKQAAPGAWSDGLKYVSMARKALYDGQKRQAERFIHLGTVHIKIARATLEQANYSGRAEAAWKRKQAALLERERVVSEIEKLRTAEARRDMNRHLESVLPPNRRREAAEEEQAERAPSGHARRQVGLEMLARVQVWLDIVSALTGTGIDESLATRVGEQIERAQEKLVTRDMVAFQEDLEGAVVTASRGLDKFWTDRVSEQAAIEQAIVERSKALGVEISAEPFGMTTGFSFSTSKKSSGTKSLNKWLETVAGLIEAMENVHLIVFAASGFAPGADQGSKRSLSLARKAVLKLTEAGVSKARVHARGCGWTSPLSSLRDGRERFAVLFVPVVVSK
jgi:hypothetical protein